VNIKCNMKALSYMSEGLKSVGLHIVPDTFTFMHVADAFTQSDLQKRSISNMLSSLCSLKGGHCTVHLIKYYCGLF